VIGLVKPAAGPSVHVIHPSQRPEISIGGEKRQEDKKRTARPINCTIILF